MFSLRLSLDLAVVDDSSPPADFSASEDLSTLSKLRLSRLTEPRLCNSLIPAQVT